MIKSQQIIVKLQWIFLNRISQRAFVLFSTKTQGFLECRTYSLNSAALTAILIEKVKGKRKILQRTSFQKDELPKIINGDSIQNFLLERFDLETNSFQKETAVLVRKKNIHLIGKSEEFELRCFVLEEKRIVKVVCDKNLKQSLCFTIQKGDLKKICIEILSEILVLPEKPQYLFSKEESFYDLDKKKEKTYKIICEKSKEITKDNSKIQAISRIININSDYLLLNLNTIHDQTYQEIIVLKKYNKEVINSFNLLHIALLFSNPNFYGIDSKLLCYKNNN